MSCNTMRNLELEREREEERKRKRRREEEAARQKEKERREKERRARAITTLKAKAKKYQWMLTTHGSGKFRATKPNSNDLIEFTVFADGNLQHNTPGVISMPNHANSDGFLNEIAETLKGKWKIVKRHFGGAAHAHGHTHTHSH